MEHKYKVAFNGYTLVQQLYYIPPLHSWYRNEPAILTHNFYNGGHSVGDPCFWIEHITL